MWKACLVAHLFNLDGQVALVTGSSARLGFEMAKGLASVGATVLPISRSLENLEPRVLAIKAESGNAEAAPFDVADNKAGDSVISNIADPFGGDSTFWRQTSDSAGIKIFHRRKQLTMNMRDSSRLVNATAAFHLANESAK
jgi:NADP-dependent 3-hydroxy acid dehydrogenase YdfG